MFNAGQVLDEQAVRTLIRSFIPRISREESLGLEELTPALNNVLRTTEEVRLSTSHRAVACDALCGILKNGSTAPSRDVRLACTNFDTWTRALGMYFDRSNESRIRSMKQVLETLIRVLQETPSEEVSRYDACVEHALGRCLGYLLDESSTAFCKSAMFVLEALLRKSLVTSRKVLDGISIVAGSWGVSNTFSIAEQFVYCNLQWAKNKDFAPYSARLLSTFCAGMAHQEIDVIGDAANRVCWVRPVQRLLSDHPERISLLEQHILPSLLKLNRAVSLSLFHDLPFMALYKGQTAAVDDMETRLCLLFLRIDDELDYGLAEEVFPVETNGNDDMNSERLSFTERVCINLLHHPNPEVRLTALTILTYPNQAARPLNPLVIDELSVHAWDFLEDTDARIRSDYLATVKRLFKKLEAVAYRLERLKTSSGESGGRQLPDSTAAGVDMVAVQAWERNLSLISIVENRCLRELSPSASYQRHILALRILSYARAMNLPAHTQKTLYKHDKRSLRSLIDLVMNPFDDVRSAAASLAASFEPEFNILEVALDNAETLMRASGRADHADGYGRLVEISQIWNLSKEMNSQVQSPLEKTAFACANNLLDEIKDLVQAAAANLEHAVTDAPLHGKLIALRCIVSSPIASSPLCLAAEEGDNPVSRIRATANALRKSFVRSDSILVETIGICQEIWNLVTPILCDDSPEGTNFLAVEDEDGPDIGIKDTLSYCWRALKESSLLLRVVMDTKNEDFAISAPDLKHIGELLFHQLSQLRHRGAFSAVAQTFAAFCIHCTLSRDEASSEIFEDQYTKTLALLVQKSTALTRRSAGLPALIVGLLCARTDDAFASKMVADLQEISLRQIGDGVTSDLPQVHALNCLKDIFTNTRLGPVTEPYLSQTLNIAAECLDKDLWAIRNSGLMLLKALLLRLEEGRASSGLSSHAYRRARFSQSAYAKHEGLSQIVVGLLRKASKAEADDDGAEEVGRLVEKTFPAIEIIERIGLPTSIEGEVKALLFAHLSSPSWAMRNKAAGCLALILRDAEFLQFCSAIGSIKAQNQLHGSLLLIRHAIRQDRFRKWQDTYEILVRNLESLAAQCCPFIQELYLEILFLLMAGQTLPSNDDLKLVTEHMSIILCHPNRSAGLETAAAQLWGLTRVKLGGKDTSFQILEPFIAAGSPAVNGILELLGAAEVTNSAADVAKLVGLVRECRTALDVECLPGLLEHICAAAVQCLPSVEDSHQRADLGNQLADISTELIVDGSTPTIANKAIVLWGVAVGILHQDQQENDSSIAVQSWYSLLQVSLGEEDDHDIREAAIDSVESFQKVLSANMEQAGRYDLLPLWFILYDGINDDDDDIRLRSAAVVSWLLSNRRVGNSKKELVSPPPSQTLTPTAARARVLGELVSESHQAPLLAHEAVRRIAGNDLSNICGTPFASSLEKARVKSVTLFDEERQNLFVDDAREARSWCKVALELPSECLNVLDDPSFSSWVAEGFQAFTELSGAHNPSGLATTFSGPLGSLSMPFTFTLCKRLLHLAEVLVFHRPQASAASTIRSAACTVLNTASEHRSEISGLPGGIFEVLQRLGGETKGNTRLGVEA